MRFVIRPTLKLDGDTHEYVYEWELAKGDDAIAAGPKAFATEADARASIAAFRKSAGGVKFAKTEVE